MLSVYVPQGTSLQRVEVSAGGDISQSAVWIDLVNPTIGEDKLVERYVGVAVPTREEMQEIEVSSRLYVENGARYMTATLMCQSDTETPKHTTVTFILASHKLITVRYDDPKPFALVANKLSRACSASINGEQVMMDLLDAVIDRVADILEQVGMHVDKVSHAVFDPARRRANRTLTYGFTLRTIGREGDLTSKVRESLVSVGRLLGFLAGEAEAMKWPKDMRTSLQSLQRDVSSLSDHTTFLTNKITFLLDAMVGFVTIEQNNVIKIFSVVAVVLMPPTLVASIYGMNFKHMPELDWFLGYPMALGMMLLAAILPYVFFKWRKWL